jgi:hypothetical protein
MWRVHDVGLVTCRSCKVLYRLPASYYLYMVLKMVPLLFQSSLLLGYIERPFDYLMSILFCV